MGGPTDSSERSAHPTRDGDRREPCDRCEQDTPHKVRIEIRTESTESENAAYSREPYRVSICMACGEELITRMNDS